MSSSEISAEEGEGTRACARRRLDKRLVQNTPRKDGSPGNYYLRVRVRPPDSWSKSLRVDIPMETNDRAEARARAAYVVRTLVRLGRRVMGDLSPYLQQAAPSLSRKRRRRRRKREQGENEQLFLF